MDGQILQGIGAILGGIAAVGGLLFAVLKGQRIADFFRSQTVIIGERDEARASAIRLQSEAAFEHSVSVVAERRANNLQDYADETDKRIALLEERLDELESERDAQKSEIEQLRRENADTAAFQAELIEYTREILEWAVRAESIAKLGGVQLASIPPIPEFLAIRLSMPRIESDTAAT